MRPRRDEHGNPAPLNFKCPQSSIPCEVYSSSHHNVLTLTKLDPKIPEWGDFEWGFEVIQKQNQYSMQNWNNGYAPYGESYVNQGDGYSVDYVDGTAGSTGAGHNDNAQGLADATESKACPACTFENTPGSTVCDICQTSLY